MNKSTKIIIVALAIILVFGILVTIGIANHRKGDKQTPTQSSLKQKSSFAGLSNTFTSSTGTPPSYQDLINLPAPINKKQLNEIAMKIANLDFPECSIVFDKTEGLSGTLEDCKSRIFFEAARIKKVRDPKLVPELIKIAKKKTYKVPEMITEDYDGFNRAYKDSICYMRYKAIEALGDIKDKKAVEPLMELLVEGDMNNGCYFYESEIGVSPDITCMEASYALLKIHPEGVISDLMSNIDKYKIGLINEQDINYKQIYYCNVIVLSQLDEGRSIILNKLKDGKLSDSEIETYLRVASSFPLTIENQDIYKKYLLNKNENISNDAAVALIKKPISDNIPLYKWMLEQGYGVWACKAFGELNSKEASDILINIIRSNDNNNIDYAVIALNNYDKDIVKPILPLIIDKLKSDRSFASYPKGYNLLIKVADPNTLKDLAEIAHNPAISSRETMIAIGRYPSPEIENVFLNIIENPNVNKDYRLFALKCLMDKKGEQYKSIGLKYFDQKEVEFQWAHKNCQ